jgi:hypothetical protein
MFAKAILKKVGRVWVFGSGFRVPGSGHASGVVSAALRVPVFAHTFKRFHQHINTSTHQHINTSTHQT